MNDIEDVMNKIKNFMVIYIPYYIYLISEEKGDNLLGDFSLLETNNHEHVRTEDGRYILVTTTGEFSFQEDSYNLWALYEIPNYRVSFLQFIDKDPIVTSKQGITNLEYSIRITAFIQDTGDINVPIVKERYNRIIMSIINEVLASKFSGILITDMNSTLMQTQTGMTYDLASVSFSLDITY